MGKTVNVCKLTQYEEQISVINNDINKLLEKREKLLMKWKDCFDRADESNLTCEYEEDGNTISLYLANGSYRFKACYVWREELAYEPERLDHIVVSNIRLHNLKNNRGELTDLQMNLILAKVAELRSKLM